MKLHSFFESLRELRTFLLLFTTQALSSLGSAMTSYALVIWAYQQSGSALSTALLAASPAAPAIPPSPPPQEVNPSAIQPIKIIASTFFNFPIFILSLPCFLNSR